MKHNSEFLKICEEAKAEIAEITLEELKQRQQQGKPYTLIDVREDHEWEKGRLPGATHLGRGIIERDIEKLYPEKNTEMTLYCGGGYRSALAAKQLKKMGYSNIFSLSGGVRGWKDAGFPLVTDEI